MVNGKKAIPILGPWPIHGAPLLPRPPAWMSNTDQENQHDGIPPRLIFCGSIAITILSLGTCPALAQPHSAVEPPPAQNSLPRLDNSPNLRTYDLGNATLNQPGVSSSWQEMPYSLNGTLGIPSGEGPFPVVMLLHGRHPGCHFVEETNPSPWPCPAGTETRFDQGLAYLAQALTEAGYLTLAPNLNAAYANAYGATAENRTDLVDVRSQQIIDAHLESLSDAHKGGSADFGISLAGKADLGQLAIIGHSLGGGTAVRIARQSWEEPDQFLGGGEFSPIQALLLVSPTPSRSVEQEPWAYALPDIPTSIVVGGCDRDIYDLSSLYYFETANTHPNRETPVVSLLVPGANHNFFNTTVQQDDYYRQPDNAPLCNPQQSTLRLSRVEQENFLVDYSLHFLDQTLKPENNQTNPGENKTTWQPLISPDKVSPFTALTNIAIPQAQRQLVFNPSSAVSNTSRPLASGSVAVTACPVFQPCNGGMPRHPRFPKALHITWSKAGGQLRFPVSPQAGLQHAISLQLRVAAAPDTTTPSRPDGFAIVLRDQSGQAVRVEIPPSTQALQRLPSEQASPHSSLTYPSLVNIPLGQFRGVHLTRLTAVDFVFDAGTEGSIVLAEVKFLRNLSSRSRATPGTSQ